MFFSWWKNRRRRKILRDPFPAEWEAILTDLVAHDRILSPADRVKLRRAIQVIVAEKEWEGCCGLEISDEIRVVIAALAAILILGFDDFYFERVQTILVYPNAFVVKDEKGIGSVVLNEETENLGQAHSDGPVILSWAETRDNALNPEAGCNLVFHEFAHQLDILNGAFDGTPNLPTDALAKRWSHVMDAEYRRLVHAERKGRSSLFDPYGASNPAEFFAVATECFFDTPQEMRSEHSELYRLFRDYFRQDPAEWRPFENTEAPGIIW